MKILDRYIVRQYLGTFAFMLGILLGISVVIDITEKIDDFLEHKLSLKTIIFDYYIHFIPWIGMYLAPIFVFISVVFFTTRLTNNSEIIAMLNGRMSFYRILVPYLFSAGLLTAFFLSANHYWLPLSNKQLFEFTEKYTTSNPQLYDSNIHFQFKKDTFVYAQNWNSEDSTAYRFSLETFKGRRMVYKIAADRVIWDTTKNCWRAENFVERKAIDGEKDQINTAKQGFYQWGFLPEDFLIKIDMKEAMTTGELTTFIRQQKEKGAENLQFYEVEKHRRTAVPVGTIILTLIAVAMTTQKRRDGIGVYIVTGLILSGIYMMLQQFSTVFATKGNMAPAMGAWLPNIIFSILAILLIFRAPK